VVNGRVIGRIVDDLASRGDASVVRPRFAAFVMLP
jgi:hypothetical protein